jgi:hypothetical protein
VEKAYPAYPNNQSVCNSDQLAAWVGNNTLVVSGYENGLWELPATGGHPHPILEGDDQNSDWYGGLSVSPDGGTIAGYPLVPAIGTLLVTVPSGGGSPRVLFTQRSSFAAYLYPQWLDNNTLVLEHTGGTQSQPTSRVAISSATSFSPTDINPSDTTARFPALAPASGLQVMVKVLGSIRSGLAVDGEYPPGGLVNFTALVSGGQDGSVYAAPNDEGQRCISGCANLLVTVVDSITHRPVEGATVSASVGPIARLDLDDVGLEASNNEFLCLESDRGPAEPQSPCGTDLPDLTTDKQGRVHLIYWAPGLVDPAQTTLDVSAAKRECPGGPCTTKGGTAEPTRLAVHPYLIYQANGELAAKELDLLVELAQEPNHFAADVATDHYAQHLIEHALLALDLFEEHAASIAGVAGLVVSTTVHAVEALSKLGEQRGLVATLLEAEDLRTLGLASEAYATNVPADVSPYFAGHLLDGLGNVYVPGFPKAGPSGMLWTDAIALSEAKKRAGTVFATRPETIALKVYEISHCDEAYAVCGPGYKNLPAAASIAVENHHGIQAQLCFYFTGSGGFAGFRWDDHFCEDQYAAPYWMDAQPDLIKDLP